MKHNHVTALMALALLLASCTRDGVNTTPTNTALTATSVNPTVPPTATAASTSLEMEAALHAEEVARAYYRAQTSCLADPKSADPTCFDSVAIGTELLNMHNALAAAQQMQTKVVGEIRVDVVTQVRISLADDTKATPPVVPTVALRVCRDLSNFNVVDKDGNSIVPPGRKPRGVDVLSLYNYHYPNPATWRVGYVASDGGATC